jgi:hypothetical protein
LLLHLLVLVDTRVRLVARGGGGVVVAALVRIGEDLLCGTDVLLP